MFKAIKNEKIIAINDSENFPCLMYDIVVEDTDHTCSDYEQYDGAFLLKEDVPAPTLEELQQARAEAYRQEVDPITSHISRLRDEDQPDEAKIAELIQQRSEKVAAIKQQYPYPEDTAQS